ncbi:SCP2 sterol-binding domain-containing protein [Streptomyces sp. NPDC004262]
MAVNIKQLFTEDLQRAMAVKPEQARAIGATFQFNITGNGGGHWLVNASSSGPSVTEGDASADVTITITTDNFQSLYADPNAYSRLLVLGKLKATGDPELLPKLNTLFSLGR